MRVKVRRIGANEPEKVEITGEFIKLDSFLKFCAAVQTGGEAKLIIAGGEVTVNGEVCNQRGKKLRNGDTVAVLGHIYRVAAGES